MRRQRVSLRVALQTGNFKILLKRKEGRTTLPSDSSSFSITLQQISEEGRKTPSKFKMQPS